MLQPKTQQDVIREIRGIRFQLSEINDAFVLGVIDGNEPQLQQVMKRLREDLQFLEETCDPSTLD